MTAYRTAAAVCAISGLCLVPAAGLSGCSSTTTSGGATTQCKVDADCAALGQGQTCVNSVCTAPHDGGTLTDASADAPLDAASDPWSCVGKVQWSAENPSTTVHLTEQWGYRGSQKPFAGTDIYSCGLHDPTCATPIDHQTTDSNGTVILGMPQYFRGFMYMPSRNDDAGSPLFVPTLTFVFPPPAADASRVGVVLNPVFTPQSWAQVAGILGASPDPNLGSAAIFVTDCLGVGAADIHLDIQPVSTDPQHPTVVGYVSPGGVPTTTPAQTTSDGGIGAFNVPAGNVTFTATNVKLGKVVGTVSLPVRSGMITGWVFPPTP